MPPLKTSHFPRDSLYTDIFTPQNLSRWSGNPTGYRHKLCDTTHLLSSMHRYIGPRPDKLVEQVRKGAGCISILAHLPGYFELNRGIKQPSWHCFLKLRRWVNHCSFEVGKATYIITFTAIVQQHYTYMPKKQLSGNNFSRCNSKLRSVKTGEEHTCLCPTFMLSWFCDRTTCPFSFLCFSNFHRLLKK